MKNNEQQRQTIAEIQKCLQEIDNEKEQAEKTFSNAVSQLNDKHRGQLSVLCFALIKNVPHISIQENFDKALEILIDKPFLVTAFVIKNHFNLNNFGFSERLKDWTKRNL